MTDAQSVGLRICWLYPLPMSKTPSTKKRYSGHGTKQHLTGEAPVLEIWRVRSISSLPDPLWPGVVVPLRVPSMVQIDLFKNYSLDKNTWNHITECKLIVWRIAAYRNNYLKLYNCVWIISIRKEYLKPYNCVIIICIR